MRRKDKEITDRKIIDAILHKNTVCHLALCDGEYPYVIPLTYGYADNTLYFHSAREGKKLDIIRHNKRCCFDICDAIEVVEGESACRFGNKYRSLVGYGQISIIDDEKGKAAALDILMEQQTGRSGWTYTKEDLERVLALKLSIESINCKSSGY